MGGVKAQLHRAGDLIDVLPARSRGKNEALVDFALFNREIRCDRDACHSLLSHVVRSAIKGKRPDVRLRWMRGGRRNVIGVARESMQERPPRRTQESEMR